jgi:hypothetical protein
MESYESSAVLEWWANRSICLGSFGIQITVTAESVGWRAQAWATSPFSAEDREGFDFLMALDPVFTLRFDDDSTVLVHVTEQDQYGHLVISEFSGGS